MLPNKCQSEVECKKKTQNGRIIIFLMDYVVGLIVVFP